MGGGRVAPTPNYHFYLLATLLSVPGLVFPGSRSRGVSFAPGDRHGNVAAASRAASIERLIYPHEDSSILRRVLVGFFSVPFFRFLALLLLNKTTLQVLR